MTRIFVILGILFNVAVLGSLFFVGIMTLLFSYYGHDLPTAEEIENYKPATLSRVYSKQGITLGLFGSKKRVYTPVKDIPNLVKNAFISAEDKNFYSHAGYDPVGLLKAIYDAFKGKKLRGASTITQQVMKNFLLSSERTGKRKIKEIILASRIEKVLSKEEILNVYLNEIYLGQGSYGVTAAAITYFGKRLEDLNVSEVAFLAALPKAPSYYHPVRRKKQSIERRNFVIKELFENGYINSVEAKLHKLSDLKTIIGEQKVVGQLSLKRENSYFNDEIRSQIIGKFGKEIMTTDGLSVRATVDPYVQSVVKETLQSELTKFDTEKGIYRGPIGRLSKDDLVDESSIIAAIQELKLKVPIDNWRLAVVKNIDEKIIKLLVLKEQKKPSLINESIFVPSWIKQIKNENGELSKFSSPALTWNFGDIIYVGPSDYRTKKMTRLELKQVPEAQGAFIVMNSKTGEVLALQGGFSYELSAFNRATRALRQPGSLFKPFVYIAALQNGLSPNSLVVDYPISIKQVDGIWSPKNFSEKWFGVAPMRKGLEFSRNLMTVRLAQEIGMREVEKYAQIFKLYEKMPHYLSYSLGSGETSLLKLVTAYSMLANGGLDVEPAFFDLIHDRYGKKLYSHGSIECIGCYGLDASKNKIPSFTNYSKRVINPETVAQINSFLRGVVERGTASSTVGKLGLDIAGKTGTTNNSKDVWFIGYTPDFVAGCYIGYDKPKSLGTLTTGGKKCGAMFAKFVKSTFKHDLIIQWPLPQGVNEVNVDYNTGQLIPDSELKVSNRQIITELFKEGNEPLGANRNNIIDGGFSMGQDLLTTGQINELDKKNKEENSRNSAESITSGDLY